MKQLSLLLLFTILLSCKNKLPDQPESSQPVTNSTLPDDPYTEKRKLMNAVNESGTVPNGTLFKKDSSTVTINDFKGKLLVLDFWATWCSPCIKEAPFFYELSEKYKQEDIEFMAISVDDTFPYWREYVEDKNLDGNQYWIGSHEKDPFFALTYFESEVDSINVVTASLPKYVFISPEGKILHNHFAPKPSTPEFEEIIKQFLN